MLTYSIIVPTYNEEKDIQSTINHLLAIRYPNKEIIFVDDSTDSTPIILKQYESRDVRIIKPLVRKGRCEARNIGIHAAIGDIIVILNADVFLPNDFLDRLNVHYEQGADFVCVNAEVKNINDLFARYVECAAKAQLHDDTFTYKRMWWTEGFSVRKSIAMQTKLFPTDFVVPICAGEDGYFGEHLEKIGAKKVVDLSITVTHVAPSSLLEYWNVRKGRGQGTPQIRRFLHQWSYQKIFLRALLKVFRFFFTIFLILPLFITVFKYSRMSSKNTLLDFFLFSYAWVIEQCAMITGEFQSLFEIMSKEKKSQL